MSCPDCDRTRPRRLLWVGLVLAVVLALVYAEGALAGRVPHPATLPEPQERP